MSEIAHLRGRFCFHILKNMAQNINQKDNHSKSFAEIGKTKIDARIRKQLSHRGVFTTKISTPEMLT